MVVLEVVRRASTPPVGADVLQGLLELLCEAEPQGAQPLALLAEDRYALHLSVTADNVPEAIVTAVVRWENVTKRLGLHGWDARRAEVMTKVDFEKEAQTLVGPTWRAGEC